MNRHSTGIGARLRIVREMVDMSQGELAEAIRRHSSQVCRWERGYYAPSPEHLAAIALATGVNLNWLILGVGEMLRQAGEK